MRTVVFPNANNTTFRSGYIKLSAYGSEWDQAVIEGNTAQLVDKLKQTSRKAAPDSDLPGLLYLKNAAKNMKIERSKMHGTLKFVGILPLPLAVRDQLSVDWASTASSFIDGAYGKIKSAGIGEASTYATGTKVLDTIGNFAADNLGWNTRNLGTGFLDKGTDFIGLGSNLNGVIELINNGGPHLARSVANSPAAQAYMKPGAGTKQILGMKSEQSLMMFHNEAAALNGTRQVIFDPGYWQSFQGVSPRGFTLTWDIIPENHEEAVHGLELCARIREFSLPQSVSGVELLSPCYWQIDWSNEYLDSQTLYSNLVIKNIEVDYAQNGEWHGSSTPKMFRITIQFEEAKAPTADIYKNGSSFIDVAVAAAGGKGGSTATAGKGALSSGKARGGKGGSPGYDGKVGDFGKAPGTGGTTDPAGAGLGGIPGAPGAGGTGIPSVGGVQIPGTIPTKEQAAAILTQGQKAAGAVVGGNWGVLDGVRKQVEGVIGTTVDNIMNNAGSYAGMTGIKWGDKAGDAAGGWVSQMAGMVGIPPNIAKAGGDWVNKQIDTATAAGAQVIKDAIRTGDFKDLGSKLGNAALNSVTNDISKTIGGAIGGKVVDIAEMIPGVDFDEATEALIEGAGKQMVKDALNGDNPFKSEAWKNYGDQIVNGLVGGYVNPVLEKMEDKAEDWVNKGTDAVEDFIIKNSPLPEAEKQKMLEANKKKREERDKALAEQRKKDAEESAKKQAEEKKRIIEEERKKWQEEQQLTEEEKAQKEAYEKAQKENPDKIVPNGKMISVGDGISTYHGTFGKPRADITDGNESRMQSGVKAAIQGLNADDLKGSEVFLSTGTLKDPRDIPANRKLIEEQLQLLTSGGACMVTVSGVPTGTKGADAANKMIKEIVDAYAAKGFKVRYAGAPPKDWNTNDLANKDLWVRKPEFSFTGCSAVGKPPYTVNSNAPKDDTKPTDAVNPEAGNKEPTGTTDPKTATKVVLDKATDAVEKAVGDAINVAMGITVKETK